MAASDRYQTLTTTESGTTDWILLDPSLGGTVSIQVGSTGVATYTVQYTLKTLGSSTDTGDAVDSETLAAKTAASSTALNGSAYGVRLNVTSYTSGTLTLYVIQSAGNS